MSLWRRARRAPGTVLVVPIGLALGLAFLALAAPLPRAAAGRGRGPAPDAVVSWASRNRTRGSWLLVDGGDIRRDGWDERTTVLGSIRDLGTDPPLGRHERLLLDLDAVARRVSKEPRGAGAAYREILFHPAVRIVAVLAPGSSHRGPTYVLLASSESLRPRVEEVRLPLPEFVIAGEGNLSATDLWVREPGSTARAALPFDAALGDEVVVSARVGGDDEHAPPGEPLRLRLGLRSGGLELELDCDRARLVQSGPLVVGSPPEPVELAYEGAPGGRAFALSVTVRRLPAELPALPERLVAGRQRELALVRRAGL